MKTFLSTSIFPSVSFSFQFSDLVVGETPPSWLEQWPLPESVMTILAILFLRWNTLQPVLVGVVGTIREEYWQSCRINCIKRLSILSHRILDISCHCHQTRSVRAVFVCWNIKRKCILPSNHVIMKHSSNQGQDSEDWKHELLWRSQERWQLPPQYSQLLSFTK